MKNGTFQGVITGALIGVAAVAALGMMDSRAQRRMKQMASDSVQKVTDKAENCGASEKLLDGRLAKPIRLAVLGALALLLTCLMWRQVHWRSRWWWRRRHRFFAGTAACARRETPDLAAAAGVSLAIAFLVATGALFMLIPPMVGQIGDLAERAPSNHEIGKRYARVGQRLAGSQIAAAHPFARLERGRSSPTR